MPAISILGEEMDENTGQAEEQVKMQNWTICAEQLAGAASALEKVLEKVEAQYASLNEKIDRIIAAVEKEGREDKVEAVGLSDKVAELEKTNRELQEQASRAVRRTLPAVVTTLLAKSGVDESQLLEGSALEKALAPLSVEQRIAVKGALARAGIRE